MAQFEYDIVETLKELKELKKITRKPIRQEKLDKAIRINQQTGKFDYCKAIVKIIKKNFFQTTVFLFKWIILSIHFQL